MDTTTLIVIIVLVVAALAAAAYVQVRRTKNLRGRFGPEYARAVEEAGGRRKAEARLHEREKRVEALAIRPLEANDRARFVSAWRRVQADFVDDPKAAVAEADKLLGEVMSARGYPVADFDQRAEDLSVDHPVFVDNYRAAHEIALRRERGQAGTEDLRQAMIHYKVLYEDLVGEAPDDRASAQSTREDAHVRH